MLHLRTKTYEELRYLFHKLVYESVFRKLISNEHAGKIFEIRYTAEELHATSTRMNFVTGEIEKYINHPIRVSLYLLEQIAVLPAQDEVDLEQSQNITDILVTALMHDTVEDEIEIIEKYISSHLKETGETQTVRQWLEKRLTSTQLDAILTITKADSRTTPVLGHNMQADDYSQWLDFVFDNDGKLHIAQIVKVADIIDNLTMLPNTIELRELDRPWLSPSGEIIEPIDPKNVRRFHRLKRKYHDPDVFIVVSDYLHDATTTKIPDSEVEKILLQNLSHRYTADTQ